MATTTRIGAHHKGGFPTNVNSTAALLIAKAVSKLFPNSQVHTDPSYPAKNRGEIQIRCPDLEEKPGPDLNAQICHLIAAFIDEGAPIATIPREELLAVELGSASHSWPEPHFSTTADGVVPDLIRLKFNASRRTITILFKVVDGDRTTPSAPTHARPASALTTHTKEIVDAVVTEMERVLDLGPVMDGLATGKRAQLHLNLHRSTQVILERFQNQAYSQGVVAVLRPSQ